MSDIPELHGSKVMFGGETYRKLSSNATTLQAVVSTLTAPISLGLHFPFLNSALHASQKLFHQSLGFCSAKPLAGYCVE